MPTLARPHSESSFASLTLLLFLLVADSRTLGIGLIRSLAHRVFMQYQQSI